MQKIQRISKIYNIAFPRIGCVFTNGEYRVIDIATLFKKLGITEGSFGYEVLQDEGVFTTVKVINHTLSWESVTQQIKLPSGVTKTLSFDLDPITLYKYSELDADMEDSYKVGRTIKNLRLRLQLSQDVVADHIGSNKQYISRIENDKSDLEFNTLKRIFELGFNRKLFISYFEEHNFLNTYTHSIFTNEFLAWIEKNNNRLDLIEGIGDTLRVEFEKENITSTEQLATLPFDQLTELLKSFGRPFSFYHYPETWLMQAKYLQHKDWFNLLKLQRMLSSTPGQEENSKLELIAAKETKHHLFAIET